MKPFLVELAPNRWSVRENNKDGKVLGVVEYHEFYTYTKRGKRVLAGFWKAKCPSIGWKETGWRRTETKKDAIASLTSAERQKFTKTLR